MGDLEKYAVINVGGGQRLVREGEVIDLFRLDSKKDDKVYFSEVLLLKDGKKTVVGTPLIPGATAEGAVVGLLRGKKIRVATYKAKSRYRRVIGHRDELTRVRIEKIGIKKKKK